MQTIENNLPEFEQLFENDPFKEYEQEIKLWRSVIERAIEDAFLPDTNKRYRQWKKNAIKWLNEDNKDFKLVCELAQLDKNKVLKLFKTNLKNCL